MHSMIKLHWIDTLPGDNKQITLAESFMFICPLESVSTYWIEGNQKGNNDRTSLLWVQLLPQHKCILKGVYDVNYDCTSSSKVCDMGMIQYEYADMSNSKISG